MSSHIFSSFMILYLKMDSSKKKNINETLKHLYDKGILDTDFLKNCYFN